MLVCLIAISGLSCNKFAKKGDQARMDKISNQYSEHQLGEMLQGDKQQEAIDYILNNPSSVNPFMYPLIIGILFQKGDRHQAAFWFYIFQSRTNAWAMKDPDPSASAALKASFNEVLGRPINEWAFSDPDAAYTLITRALSYEKKFPFYKGKVSDSISDADWDKVLIEARNGYADDFKTSFEPLLKDKKKIFETRKANGLYVGPWQDPGKPLLDNWK